MEKILIKLFVPAINRTFDLFVPVDLEIAELVRVIVSGVDYLCNGLYVPSNEEMLNAKDPNILFDPNLTLYSYGIKDGSELILI